MRAFLLVFLAATTASAHDFWLEPSDYSPEDGDRVGIRILVGEHGAGEVVPRDPKHIVRFVSLTKGGTQDVDGIEAADPAGWLRIDGKDGRVVVYESAPRMATMTPDVFARYVREDGLENRTTPATGDVQDTYSRCAKTFVGRPRAGATTPTGLPLEIVPLTDVYESGPLRVRVLFQGKPLTGTLVIALSDREQAEGRTREDGTVTLNLKDRGPWLVKPGPSRPAGDAAYRSWGSSVTFER